MKTFGIAATDGTLVADGLSEGFAKARAKHEANQRRERVWLYEENVFAPAEAVEPELRELESEVGS